MSKGSNLQSVNESLKGEQIEALNTLSPGLGNLIHRLFVSLGRAHDATGGKLGPVVIQKQKKKDAKGIVQPSLVMEGRTEGEDAINDQDYVTLAQLRAMLSCEKIVEKLSECAGENEVDLNIGDEICLPTAMSNSSTEDTGLTNIYAVQTMTGFIYVLGDKGGAVSYLQVYRVGEDNAMVLLSELEMTQLCTRMILQGEYILATRSGTGDLTVIDIRKPNAPVELSITANGGNGVHAQGRYAFFPKNGSIGVVDISDVGAPVQIGSAA